MPPFNDYFSQAQQMMGQQNRMPLGFGGSIADLFRDMLPNGPQPGGPVYRSGGGMGGGMGGGGFQPTPGLTIQDLAPMLQKFRAQNLMRYMPGGATYPGAPTPNPNIIRRPGVGPMPY